MAATADDGTPAPPQSGSAGGLIEQLEEDAERAADKAAELGESAGKSADRAANTAAEEAEGIFERAKQGGRKAYEWSKQQLEEIF
jgi:hypothetical protein